MKSIKLSIIVNTFFIFIATLFFSYALLFYNGKGFTLSILLSALFAIILSSAYVIIALYKGELLESKFSLDNILLSFNYYLFLKSNLEILNLLKEYYSFKKIPATVYSDHLVLQKSNVNIYALIKPEEITLTEIIDLSKTITKNKIVIIGVDFSCDVIKMIQKLNLDIALIKTRELYFSLKEVNLLPELKIYEIKKQKTDLKSVFYKIYSKNNAKKFLITGIILTITSLFTFYPIYYLVFGAILMITSILLRLKKEDTNANANALDNIVVK